MTALQQEATTATISLTLDCTDPERLAIFGARRSGTK